MPDQETQDMLNEFVSESLDNLDQVEPLIDDLQGEDYSDSVNAVFRAFHTIKGLSGFFEQMVINKVTHQAETFLDLIRKQTAPQPDSVLQIVFKCIDYIRELLDLVSSESSDQSAFEESQSMIQMISDAIEKYQNGGFFEESEEASAEEEIEAEQEEEEVQSTGFEINDELKQQFFDGAYELVEVVADSLIKLEENPEQPDLIGEAFGSIHSLKGNAGFMGFSEIKNVSEDVENILESMRSGELPVEANVITILLSQVEQIKLELENIKSPNTNPVEETQAEVNEPTVIEEELVEEQIEKFDFNDNSESSGLDKLELHEEITEKEEAPTAPEPVAPEPVVQAPKAPAPKTTPIQAKKVQRNDIRVETNKIDKLFDLVGELITIESMIMKSPDLVGLEIPTFQKSANMLNKITRELQEISMSIRMMPLEGLFNKMKRLVRDVSTKQNKKVNFTISGQETEMDKNVIDEISDPLVHLLRNACDHGVELPGVREENGKTPEGNISLSARYEGNEILIIIEDDGAGIKRDRILSKAIERNLVEGDGSHLTDSEVFMLIFEAGFSTAEQITDISGRGVGMDVVKKNIEKLRGSIDVHSSEGLGSTFILRIPLTLAIMESMLINIGDATFALPILSLRESFLCRNEDINKTMDGLELVKVREEIMPVIRLHDILEIETEITDLDQGIMIIIENREKKVCLFADGIIGQQQAVVKGLSDYVGNVPGLTGCMILGDGGIGLILDIESIIKMSEV